MSGTPSHGHLSEETLILHYYSETDTADAIDAHLATCAACRVEFGRLRQVLTLVDLQEAPEPGPGFERQVWARLAPQLPPTKQSRFDSNRGNWLARLFSPGPRWAYAGGLAALLLAAFIAGRVSRDVPSGPPAATTVATDDDLSQRVLVFAVVDHLDRTEMMLVELLNSDDAASSAGALRARELVAENRLYRVSATQAGDEAVSDVLDDLERVLVEIANTPDTAGPEALDAVRQRIASQGLLFRVRVVHSEMRARERRTVAGSTS
jgi:hypothetical protein